MATIRNPLEWGTDQLRHAASYVASSGRSVSGTASSISGHGPSVQRIDVQDLKSVLTKGMADFRASRSDVFFLCVIYPVIGLILARFAFGYNMLPLLFPATSGFALLGPLAAVGLYEMSRQREQGIDARWSDALGLIRSPSFGAVLVLGLVLLVIFLVWLGIAYAIYVMTLGPTPPVSASAFLRDVFATGAGWTMIIVGIGIGFLFALLVLAISAVSFPMLLDKDVGLGVAIATSIRVFADNPKAIAIWGLIVACGLAIGTIPLFLGLIFVMPILGHSTWHLYRKTVAW